MRVSLGTMNTVTVIIEPLVTILIKTPLYIARTPTKHMHILLIRPQKSMSSLKLVYITSGIQLANVC